MPGSRIWPPPIAADGPPWCRSVLPSMGRRSTRRSTRSRNAWPRPVSAGSATSRRIPMSRSSWTRTTRTGGVSGTCSCLGPRPSSAPGPRDTPRRSHASAESTPSTARCGWRRARCCGSLRAGSSRGRPVRRRVRGGDDDVDRDRRSLACRDISTASGAGVFWVAVRARRCYNTRNTLGAMRGRSRLASPRVPRGWRPKRGEGLVQAPRVAGGPNVAPERCGMRP